MCKPQASMLLRDIRTIPHSQDPLTLCHKRLHAHCTHNKKRIGTTKKYIKAAVMLFGACMVSFILGLGILPECVHPNILLSHSELYTSTAGNTRHY